MIGYSGVMLIAKSFKLYSKYFMSVFIAIFYHF